MGGSPDSLDLAVHRLLREATREAILPHYQALAAHEIEDKGGNDPVTIADRQSEALLTEGLSAILPGIAVVGEEAVHADPSRIADLAGDCWIVDPIDGTRNFAAGRPPFGILVALARNGIAERGWIYDCLSGRLCTAQHGKGAFVDGQSVVARPTGEATPVAAISLVFMDEGKRQGVKNGIAPHYRLVDIPYCAAEQYPRLALGQNDVSIFERTLAWDHAAGVLWLNEAGGMAARPDGSPYRVDESERRGLIGAASPALWQELANRLQSIS